MHQSTTPSLSQTIWPRWASRQFLALPIVQTLLPVTFGYSLSSEAVVMRQLRRWKRLWRKSLTRSYKRTFMGLPEVVGTVQQVHCSWRRLLRRGLEFHVCTINKSAHTKKSLETYRMLLVYTHILIYIWRRKIPSLKHNFIAYRSSKVSWRPDCIFEIHQLWQSGFTRVYSNFYCSSLFEPEILKIDQSSHKMYKQ